MLPNPESTPIPATPPAPQAQVPGQGDKPPSQDGTSDLQTVLKRLEGLENAFRTLQSGKDKDTKALSRKAQAIAEQFSKMQEYLDRYKTPEEAARQYRTDALLGMLDTDDDIPPQVPQPKTPQAGDKGKGADTGQTEKLLKVLGIDPNDPDLIGRVQAGESMLEAAIAIAESKKVPPAQQPNPAGIMPTGSGQPSETTKAALQAQYDAEVAKLPRPTDPYRIEEVKRKYRRLGLEIW